MVIFNWNIDRMRAYKNVNGMDNVVYEVAFTVYGSNGQESSFYHGTVNLQPPTNTAEFIPYDKLDHETVKIWVQQTVDKDGIEKKVADDIQIKVDPPFVDLPLPWAFG